MAAEAGAARRPGEGAGVSARRVLAGTAIGYAVLHPLAMMIVAAATPGGRFSLEPVSTAFSAAHLPMGALFAGLGAAAGLAHHRRVGGLLRRSAEEAAIRHERDRLEALIHLAGGVCHELGQPLTALLARLAILERRLPPADPLLHEVRETRAGAERMSEVLLRLGRLSRYETKPYLGNLRIVDLERSGPPDTVPPAAPPDSGGARTPTDAASGTV